MNTNLTTSDGTLGWGGIRSELSTGFDNAASSTKKYLGLEDVEDNWKKILIVLLLMFIVYVFFIEILYSEDDDSEKKRSKFEWNI